MATKLMKQIKRWAKLLVILICAALLLFVVLRIVLLVTGRTTAQEDVGMAFEEYIPTLQATGIAYKDAELEGHKLIAESGTYELYLREETLSVLLRNKSNGQIFYSTVGEIQGKANKSWKGFMQSGVVLNVIDGVNDTVQADLINSEFTSSVVLTENGFQARLFFTKFMFGFDMRVSLAGDDLVVEIPDEGIVEFSDKYKIGAINVYPFLGHTYLGTVDGYMFIPDGNGALIYLNDKEGRIRSGFSQLVYGEDTGFRDTSTLSLLWDEYQTVNASQNILAPVFGMVHTAEQIGFLGIIESGDERASIECYPNGATVDYNRIYAKFLLRKVYVQPTNKSNSGTITQAELNRSHYDIKVRYRMVSGSDADYTGLAVAYREYLTDALQIQSTDTGYKTRIDFLGTEREEWLVFKRTIAMTTVQDIEEMLKELSEQGVGDVLAIYKGWQDGGLYNVPITEYDADSDIGGTRALTELIEGYQDSNVDFFLWQDSLRINPDENSTAFNVVKRVDKRLYEEFTYMEVYESFQYLIPKRSEYLVKELMTEYREEGINQVAITGITNNLYSYQYNGVYYTRTDTKQAYQELLHHVNESSVTALDQPFSYLWEDTDMFLNMPIGTSDYNYIDEEIPFLSICLKGVLPMYSEYMNFEANKQEFFLQLIEMGIYPSFLITKEDSSKLIYTNSADIYSSAYATYRDEILRYAGEMRQVSEKTAGQYIVGHERFDNGITKVIYSGGTVIYVNYADVAATTDGVTVEAMSYQVTEN